MSREEQNWQKNNTLGALLGEEQDVYCRMQLANLAFRRMFGLFSGVSASLDQDVESLGQLRTTPQLWDMGSNHNNNRKAVCISSLASPNPSMLLLPKAYK